MQITNLGTYTQQQFIFEFESFSYLLFRLIDKINDLSLFKILFEKM